MIEVDLVVELEVEQMESAKEEEPVAEEDLVVELEMEQMESAKEEEPVAEVDLGGGTGDGTDGVGH